MELEIINARNKKPRMIADIISFDKIYIIGSGNWKWIKDIEDVVANMISHESIRLSFRTLDDFEKIDAVISFENLSPNTSSPYRLWRTIYEGIT